MKSDICWVSFSTHHIHILFSISTLTLPAITVNATTRRDPDSNIVGVVGVAQDVTESSKNDRAVAAVSNIYFKV
jgi:hypothetical protein